MKNKIMNSLILFQYFAAMAVLTINLSAHFLFLMSEAGWIRLQLYEWMQGWLFLYHMIWLIPLAWMMILSSTTHITPLRPFLITSVLPLVMLIARTILDAQLKPWFHPAASWIFAVIQLILLAMLWRQILTLNKPKPE